eukprot:3688995-Pyramimonas_sp.AAC.1
MEQTDWACAVEEGAGPIECQWVKEHPRCCNEDIRFLTTSINSMLNHAPPANKQFHFGNPRDPVGHASAPGGTLHDPMRDPLDPLRDPWGFLRHQQDAWNNASGCAGKP